MNPVHEIKICLNCGERLLAQAKRCPKCGAKDADLKIINSADTEQIEQIREIAVHEDKKGFWQKTIEQGRATNSAKPKTAHERIKENKANAVAYCPKCGSTSLSSNKKGFGIGKALLGASATMVTPLGPLGAVAGNIGAKKVIVTCLNCGHQWKM